MALALASNKRASKKEPQTTARALLESSSQSISQTRVYHFYPAVELVFLRSKGVGCFVLVAPRGEINQSFVLKE